jgi:uncharacterized repeat protein (TIGR01451 family)
MNRSKFLLLSVILIVGMLFSVSNALAYTAANTEITNQASATFDDAEGDGHSVTSNQVITTVLPIYGLTITPDGEVDSPGQSQNGSPGQTVYFQYTLTNTGNDQDSYTLYTDFAGDFTLTPADISIYRDINGNGVVDTGEPEVYSSAIGVTNVNPSQAVSLVMSYQIPVGATGGDTTKVDIQGESQGDTDQDDVDNYNQTIVVNDAVIVANKSVNVATASPGDTLTYTINASNNGNLPTTDDTLEVDIDGVGSIDSLYGVIIADILPVYDGYPFRIISGTPDGTPSSGRPVYWVGTSTPTLADSVELWGGTWYDDLSSAEAAEAGPDTYIRAIGWVTGDESEGSGVISNGQNFNFTYQLRIPVNFPDSSSPVENTARIDYDRYDNTEHEYITNTVTTEVGGDGEEILATMISPSSTANAHDLGVANEDTITVGSIAAGDVATYDFTVTNHGYSSDVINLMPGPKPSGWSVGFYYMDGTTPLGDSNTDGLQDVGELAAGGTYTIKVKVSVPADQEDATAQNVIIYARSATQPGSTLPSDITSINMAGGYTNNSGTQPDDLTLLDASAFSVGDFVNITTQNNGNVVRRISAITGNTITVPDVGDDLDDDAKVSGPITTYNKSTILFSTISGADVTYTNYDYTEPKDYEGNPADSTYIDMPLRIQNPADNNDTYTLTDSLPDSWTVKYYHDADCDSLLDPGEMTEISDIAVPGGGGKCVFARVFYPLNTEATTVDSIVKFVATSTNDTDVEDTIYNNVQINTRCGVVFSPNRQATGSPGYTVEYFHNLMNTGNTVIEGYESGSGVTTSYFTVTSPRGWSYVLYQENPTTPNQWDQLDLNSGQYRLEHDIGLNASADSRIKVKVFIPTNAPDGQVDLATIDFTYDCDGTDVSDYIEDQTTVVVSNLLLEKRVVNRNAADTTWADATNNNTGAPGDTLIYFVYFKNISSGSVDTLVIYDAIPANTTYVPGSATFCDAAGEPLAGDPDVVEFSDDNGSTWDGADDISATNLKYHYAEDPPATPGDPAGNYIPLDPGEDGYVKFNVTID